MKPAGLGALALALIAGCGRVDFVARGIADATPVDALRDATSDAPPTALVVATLTVDNSFSFAWDDVTAGRTFLPGKTASTDSELFDCPVGVGPEEFTLSIPVAPDRYLYIATWSDDLSQAGFLGKFVRAGKTTLTGDVGWQVCAVGEYYERLSNGPTATRINQAIADCNAGMLSASKGWLSVVGPVTPGAQGQLYVGDINNGSGIWPVTCQNDVTGRGIPQAARWIWWDPDDGARVYDNNLNRTKTFHLYRIASSAL